MRVRVTLLACSTLLACAACGREGTTGGAVRRDSAGIVIVENSSPLLSGNDGWKVDTQPRLRIDAGRYPIDRIVSAFRLDDGRILLADGGSNLLLLFDSSGASADTLGRPGQGPQEFRYLYSAFPRSGDSILVSDGARNYLVTLVPDGGRWRHVHVPVTLPVEMPYMAVDGVFASGTLLLAPSMEASMRNDGIERQWEESTERLLANSRGMSVRKIGPFPSGILFSSPTSMGALVFGPAAFIEVGGSQLFVAYTKEYSIKVFTEEGTLARIIRRIWAPRSVTAADIEQWRARMMSGVTGSRAADLRQHVDGARFADTHPAHGTMFPDRVGNLWVRSHSVELDLPLWRGYPGGGPSSSWSVFDSDGLWVTDVVLPAGLHPTDIGEDYVLGFVPDSDDVQHLAVYSLRKR
jgi:hypothetical protein